MDTNHTLYIRTDANEIIGTGHVMRCLAIAEAVRARGGSVVFLAADARTESLVAERGFCAVCLQTVWNDLEQELDELVGRIRREKIALLLVDSYFATPRYLETLRRYTYLAYIDDLETVFCPVDVLIRYALYSGGTDCLPGRTVLSGCSFVPLRSQFCGLPRRNISRRPERILVLTGGTDPCHVALTLARHVSGKERYQSLRFEIVCGIYNGDLEELRRLAGQGEQISVHVNVGQLVELMLAADLAVTAAGTTVYELCACGTPSVCFVLADNQIRNARAFAEEGLMLYGGDVRREGWLSGLVGQMDRLLWDRGLCQSMAESMQRLVDAKGAGRIAKALEKLLDPKQEG